jgi:transposase InsO family protein
MDNTKKETWALFRFQIIAPLLERPRGEQESLIQERVGKPIEAPNGKLYPLSRSTLMRWMAHYRKKGMEGLHPPSRKDKGSLRTFSDETACALLKIKTEKPNLTVEALIYQARRKGVFAPGQHVSKSSVWRFLKKHQVAEQAPRTDRRRFEAEAPMELVQSDVMHGPKAGGKKSYLIALIDDHSRLILWASFRWSESVEEFISVLKQALKRRGLPRKIYVDNGSAFRSHRLAYACASLGISLIHATPYQPEGKGKCERWFRTVRENFLPQLSLHDLESLERLNAALWDWIDHYYHQTVHSSTGQTPWERFIQGLKASRPAPENLDDYFRDRLLRKVGKDRIVSLNGRAFEAPIASIGKSLELRFSPDRPEEVEAFEQNQSLGFLKSVLVHSNARIKRTKNREVSLESSDKKTPPITGLVPFKITHQK